MRHLAAAEPKPGKRHTPQRAPKPVTLRTQLKCLTRMTMGFSRSLQWPDSVIGLLVNRYEGRLPG